MDKLGPKEQEAIRKLSDVRLVANLTKAGLNQDELEAMDRPAMLSKWAELSVASKQTGVAGLISQTEIEKKILDLEKQKLDLERQKLAMQADRDKNHHMLEMARLEMKKATGSSVRSSDDDDDDEGILESA